MNLLFRLLKSITGRNIETFTTFRSFPLKDLGHKVQISRVLPLPELLSALKLIEQLSQISINFCISGISDGCDFSFQILQAVLNMTIDIKAV
jgi:hypothetical protein